MYAAMCYCCLKSHGVWACCWAFISLKCDYEHKLFMVETFTWTQCGVFEDCDSDSFRCFRLGILLGGGWEGEFLRVLFPSGMVAVQVYVQVYLRP